MIGPHDETTYDERFFNCENDGVPMISGCIYYSDEFKRGQYKDGRMQPFALYLDSETRIFVDCLELGDPKDRRN